MTESFAQKMLVTASALVIGFGTLIALAAHPATDGVIVFFADLLFWPLDGLQNADKPELRLISGISGGVMIGWGVVLLGLSTKGMAQAPELSLTLMERAIIVWFVVDSVASWIAGAPLNIIGNLIFLVLFLWPIHVLRRGQTTATSTAA
ncbi:MAG: hypothetical protein AAF557_06875 [Pseudomonadota bacterium]